MSVTQTTYEDLDTWETERADAALLVSLDEELKKAKSDRLQFERQWYFNLCFYFGKHWVEWAGQAQYDYTRLVESRPKSWQVRLVTNLIRPYVRREIAKLNSERPRGFVVPVSSDDDDIAAARAAETVHGYITDSVLHLQTLHRRTDFWSVVCGTGFLKIWWDPEAEDTAMPEFSETSPEGMDLPEPEGYGLGVLRGEAVSPFHMFVPDMETEDLEGQPWVAHCSVRTPDEVMRLYGIPIEADANLVSDMIEDKMLRAANIRQQEARKGVLVKEMWIKPSMQFPEGAVVIWANHTLLYKEEGWPYEHGQYPFTKRIHVETGRFYGGSVIEDLIPLQVEYNKARSQLIENKNLMTAPQILAPKGSVDPTKWTSQPGLVVQYQPGFEAPRPLERVNLPAYVNDNIATIRTDMNEITSMHEVSKGQAPGSVEAATAIAYLQERDDALIATAIYDKEMAVQRVGQQCLAVVVQFWDFPRLVRVTGRNEVFEAHLFAKADLRGSTDWRVVEGSGYPMSRAAKQAQILELLKMGVLPPDSALQYLKMGETAKLWEELNIDKLQVERENVKMMQGVFAEVNLFDDDMIHIRTHDDYMKRQEFENLDPEIKAMLRYHVFVHLKQLAMKMNIPLTSMQPQAPPGMPGMPPDGMQMPGQEMGMPPEMPMPGMPPPQQLLGPNGAPMPPSQPQDKYPVDPMIEMELRSIYTQIVQGGGVPEPAQPPGAGVGG